MAAATWVGSGMHSLTPKRQKYHDGTQWVASYNHAIPVGSWFTVRQETNFSTGAVSVELDGVMLASHIGTLPTPPFGQIMFNGVGSGPRGVCWGAIYLYEGNQ